MKNINTAMKFEANRRSNTLSNNNITFSQGEKIDEEKMNKVISNLTSFGQTKLGSQTEKQKAKKEMITSLIEKIIAANSELIKLP